MVLLRQQLRGRHERRLIAVFDREQHAEEGHDRLPGPHVPHEQPVHADRGRHVGRDLPHGAALGGGEGKGELRLESGRQVLFQLEADSRAGTFRQGARARLHELLIEEFVEREPPASFFRRGDARRPVDGRERSAQPDEAQPAGKPAGMRVHHDVEKDLKVLGHESPELAVREALGRRIDWQDDSTIGRRLPRIGEHEKLARRQLLAVVVPDRTVHQQELTRFDGPLEKWLPRPGTLQHTTVVLQYRPEHPQPAARGNDAGAHDAPDPGQLGARSRRGQTA